jgi:GNAT superfamily N-acetyltransferase
MNERRVMATENPGVRNVPVRARAWQQLLDAETTEAVESEGGEMAIAFVEGQLQLFFAFETMEAMKAAFRAMWDALHEELQEIDLPYLRFDLVQFPVREWIDPMLDEVGFVPFGEWMELEHRELADLVPPEAPGGVRIRRATEADFDRIVAIEEDSYEDFADGEEATRARLESAAWAGVLEEDGEVIGYAINGAVEGGVGRILSSAVAAEQWGRGLGVVMLQAAAFQIASQGARQAVVRGRPSIPRSVPTAVAAGFRPGRSGTEFRRSLDEEEIAERRRKRQYDGVKARFGNWR